MSTNLPVIEAGEALPVKWTSNEDMSGASVIGWISVNGGAAVSVGGSVDAGGRSGYVGLPGDIMVIPPGQTRGWYRGEIVFTASGAIWSPKVEPFSGEIVAAVRPVP